MAAHGSGVQPRHRPGSVGGARCDSDEIVRAEVADNPNTPAGVLEVLAGDACDAVRCFVARNPALAERLLRSLAADESERVRVAAAENPSLRSEVWAVLAGDRQLFRACRSGRLCAAVSQTEAFGGLRGGVVVVLEFEQLGGARRW